MEAAWLKDEIRTVERLTVMNRAHSRSGAISIINVIRNIHSIAKNRCSTSSRASRNVVEKNTAVGTSRGDVNGKSQRTLGQVPALSQCRATHYDTARASQSS